jgi:hypothetical protein
MTVLSGTFAWSDDALLVPCTLQPERRRAAPNIAASDVLRRWALVGETVLMVDAFLD